jgi:hypothetical protein
LKQRKQGCRLKPLLALRAPIQFVIGRVSIQV